MLSLAGEILERKARGDGEKSWRGRDPSSCRWKRGQFAACVYGRRYRIGVVLAPPPSPEWIHQHPGLEVTRGDDVYLLGFADDDHHHPSDAELFEPLAGVPAELRAQLVRRLREYPLED